MHSKEWAWPGMYRVSQVHEVQKCMYWEYSSIILVLTTNNIYFNSHYRTQSKTATANSFLASFIPSGVKEHLEVLFTGEILPGFCYGSNCQDNPEGSRCSEHYVIFFDTWTSLLITIISLSSMLRNLVKIWQDLTSSRCSGCCVLSHHSRFCGYTIVPLLIFISEANN